MGLQCRGVERLEAKAREELDARVELPVRAFEGAPLFRLRSRDRGRIVDAPVRGQWMTRPMRTVLARGLSAHGDHEIEGRRFGRRELVPALAAQALGGQV